MNAPTRPLSWASPPKIDFAAQSYGPCLLEKVAASASRRFLPIFTSLIFSASSVHALTKAQVLGADIGMGESFDITDIIGIWDEYGPDGVLTTELHYYPNGSFEFANRVWWFGLQMYGWSKDGGRWAFDGFTLSELRAGGVRKDYRVLTVVPGRLLRLRDSSGRIESYSARVQ